MTDKIDRKKFGPMLDSFVEFASKRLKIDPPKINYKSEDDTSLSFGGYTPSTNEISVATKDRHPMDIFRTIAHELVHHKQNGEGRIKDVAQEGSTGSDIENEANSEAGKIMRWFAQANPEHFGLSHVTEETLFSEGINDASTHKAVFLVGGPGSGKDFIMNKALQGHGLTEINSDNALEYLMKKHNLDFKMPPAERRKRDRVRGRAKNITREKERLAIMGRKGIIINGTGADPYHIMDVKDHLEKHGYKSMMVFVDTDDKTSKDRVKKRYEEGGRNIPERIRKQKWNLAQEAVPVYKKVFGDENFRRIDNSKDLRTVTPDEKQQIEKSHNDLFKHVRNFTQSKDETEQAKQWKESERTRLGITQPKPNKISPTFNKTVPIHLGTRPQLSVQQQIKENEIDPSKREFGTTSLADLYKKMTPGQQNASIVSWSQKPETIAAFAKKYGKDGKKKLEETAFRLHGVFEKIVKESLDKGVFDLATVSNTGKDDRELGEDKPSENDAYEAGKLAKKNGKKHEDNPHFGETIRGIRRYKNETLGSAWAKGMRDQTDSTSKQFPDIRLFRKKANRYYK